MGMKTHASWKNGLFEDPAVESRRECVGEEPMSSPKIASYWRRVNWSAEEEETEEDLEGWYQSLALVWRLVTTDLVVPFLSANRSTTYHHQCSADILP